MVKSKADYNLEYIFIYELFHKVLFDLTIPCIFSERNDTSVYITEFILILNGGTSKASTVDKTVDGRFGF